MIGPTAWKRLSEQMSRGEVVLFTGAGFSVGARDLLGNPVPQADQLTTEIAELVWPGEGPDDQLSLPDTYAAALREKRTALSKLMLERLTVDPATVTQAQRTWFSMPWLRCYTLNIDDLESAAARAGNLPRRIESHSGLDGTVPLGHGAALLYVHLNGLLSDVPDVTFSEPQFGHRHTQSNPLYEVLAADLISYPVVFVGTELHESLFWRYLALRDDKGDRGVREMRPRSYLITPELPKDRRRMLAAYNIEHVEATADEFAAGVLAKLGCSVAQGFKAINLKRGLAGGSVSLPSVNDLASQPSPEHSEYLWGVHPTWADIHAGRAVERAFESSLHDLSESRCVILTGTTGTGVSTVLMRLALKLASENDVRWLDANHEFDGHELSDYLKGTTKPVTVCIDDADTFGRSLRDLVDDVVTFYPNVTLILALRASRIDQVLPNWRADGTTTREFTVPELEDADIDALLGALARDNKLGALKKLSPAERIKELRHRCGRQLIVAMYEATHGGRFEDKLSDELGSLQPEQRLIYAIVCLASSLRFSLTRDEILAASGDLSNTGLYALNRLVARGILTQKANTYKARHRVIAEVITEALRGSGQLLGPYRGLAYTMARRYDRTKPKERETKLIKALLDHWRIGRNFDLSDARAVYGDVERLCAEDYHFWLQRGSLEVQVPGRSVKTARPYLLSARDGGQHDHRVHNEWAYYLLKDAWLNPSRPSSIAQVHEAEDILLTRLAECDGDDVYAWHIYGNQMLKWLRVGPLQGEAKARKLEEVKRRLEDGVRRHPADHELRAVLLTIQAEWLGMAVPRA